MNYQHVIFNVNITKNNICKINIGKVDTKKKYRL